MGFDYREYQLNLAVARREASLGLSWAGVVFDPSKHPRLAGKFTVSNSGSSKILTPKDRHPTVHHFVVTPGSKKGKVLASAVLHTGTKIQMHQGTQQDHDKTAAFVHEQMLLGNQAGKRNIYSGGHNIQFPGKNKK